MVQISEFLSPGEFRPFLLKSDWRASGILLANWAIIFGAFSLVCFFPNILTVLIALFVLGGRQLGLAILMHEAGHNILFRTTVLNRVLGQWLCAYPVLADVESYASNHRAHHRFAGSKQDPDLPNYQAYPISRASFRRKVMRDLSGQTGFRLLYSIFSGQGDRMTLTGSNTRHVLGGLLVNVLLFALLWLTLSPWLYLLWPGAFLTTFPLFARIRQVAEHGGVANLFDPDPREHTRTTVPNLLERLLLCPNYVNYHCEHHLVPSVPCYHLRELHRLLTQRGYYDSAPTPVAHGYRQVLEKALDV